MLFEQKGMRSLLRGMVRRLTPDKVQVEDLIQEGLINLWLRERDRPGQTKSWYIEGCRFHLQNLLRKGRSVDSGRHRAPAGFIATDGQDDVTADFQRGDAVLGQVCAHDLIDELSKWLTAIEKEILVLSADGLSVREIARNLGVSHTCIVKRRRNIADLAARLGIDAPKVATGPTPAQAPNGKRHHRPRP